MLNHLLLLKETTLTIFNGFLISYLKTGRNTHIIDLEIDRIMLPQLVSFILKKLKEKENIKMYIKSLKNRCRNLNMIH